MNKEKYVFAQLISFLNEEEFRCIVISAMKIAI